MPRTATAKVTKASSNPVIRSNVIDSAQEQVGQDVPRVLKSTGPASEALSPADNSQQFDRIMRSLQLVEGQPIQRIRCENRDSKTYQRHEHHPPEETPHESTCKIYDCFRI